MIETWVSTGNAYKQAPTYIKKCKPKNVHLQGMPKYLDNKQMPLQGIIKLKCAFKTPIK